MSECKHAMEYLGGGEWGCNKCGLDMYEEDHNAWLIATLQSQLAAKEAELGHYYSVVLASASDLRKIETALCNKYGVTGISNAVDRVEKTLAALLEKNDVHLQRP